MRKSGWKFLMAPLNNSPLPFPSLNRTNTRPRSDWRNRSPCLANRIKNRKPLSFPPRDDAEVETEMTLVVQLSCLPPAHTSFTCLQLWFRHLSSTFSVNDWDISQFSPHPQPLAKISHRVHDTPVVVLGRFRLPRIMNRFFLAVFR